MDAARLVIAWAGPLTILVVLTGLVVRRRLGLCYSFVAYLVAVLTSDLLVMLWPARFFWQWFWLSKELVIAVCRFAVGLELTYRTFRAFPGARATARRALLFLLLLTLGALTLGSEEIPLVPGEPELAPLISHLQPRLLNGTVWLLTGIAALVLWYRVPVVRFHKVILSGFVPYLLVFTTALSLLERWGWTARARAEILDASAYLALLAYWAVAAWRGDEPLEAGADESAE